MDWDPLTQSREVRVAEGGHRERFSRRAGRRAEFPGAAQALPTALGPVDAIVVAKRR